MMIKEAIDWGDAGIGAAEMAPMPLISVPAAGIGAARAFGQGNIGEGIGHLATGALGAFGLGAVGKGIGKVVPWLAEKAPSMMKWAPKAWQGAQDAWKGMQETRGLRNIPASFGTNKQLYETGINRGSFRQLSSYPRMAGNFARDTFRQGVRSMPIAGASKLIGHNAIAQREAAQEGAEGGMNMLHNTMNAWEAGRGFDPGSIGPYNPQLQSGPSGYEPNVFTGR
jgi:hypothetical protein